MPVLIDGKGPYPFVLAPDAPRSTIDGGVAEALGLDDQSDQDPTATHDETCEEANGVQLVQVDHAGTARRQLVQPTTSVARVDGVTAVPGQGVLASSRIDVDRHRRRTLDAPRAPDLAATAAVRIARRGTPFAACAATGCATVARDGDALAVTPALPGRYQVTVEARDRAGRRLELLRVTVADGPTRMPLEGRSREADALRVVDAAPDVLVIGGAVAQSRSSD